VSYANEWGTTFWIYYVPVTVTLGVSAKASVPVKIEFRPSLTSSTTTCLLKADLLHASLAPQAHADAFGTAAVGLSFFKGGLKGSVTVVDAKLPFHATLGFQLGNLANGAPVSLALALDTSLDFKLSALDGKLSVFGSLTLPIIGEQKIEAPIFSWQGIKHDWALWNRHFAVDLVALEALNTDLTKTGSP